MDSPRTLPAGGFDAVAARFRSLADPNRLRLLYALMHGEKTVSELTEALQTTQPNASRHLQHLLREGLVRRDRRGSHALYSIQDESVVQLCELVCGSIQKRIDEAQKAFAG